MSVTSRQYNPSCDYNLISQFLIDNHIEGNQDGNWLEPAWEYMYYHPYLDQSLLPLIRIWEDDGKIVALTHFECTLGEAFFQFDLDHKFLFPEMLDHAERNLSAILQETGKRVLHAFVNDNAPDFVRHIDVQGYSIDKSEHRPIFSLPIYPSIQPIELPKGYRITDLKESSDWSKVNRVLWRGFDHEGEPPCDEAELESRRRMFETPKAKRDLKIAVVSPKDDFVAFCGTFYEPVNHYAYVEPVATDPDYRRLGLGRAAVLEALRRCALLGADVAYVGSDQLFYQSLGFKKVFTSECWTKVF